MSQAAPSPIIDTNSPPHALTLPKTVLDDLTPTNIAHCGSHTTMWGGDVRFPYSVLQHALIVADAMPQVEWRAYGLLHCPVELVVFGNIPTPISQLMTMVGFNILGLQRQAQNHALAQLSLVTPTKEIAIAVDAASQRTGATELRDVVRSPENYSVASAPPMWRTINCRDRETVKDEWLNNLANYAQMAHGAGLERK